MIRQIKLDDKHVYRGITSKMTMLKLWEKNFLNETSKFISATHLKPQDLGREFSDEKGVAWKILGMLEDSREVACEKSESGEIFTHDRWKVSQLVYPEVHKRMAIKSETILPSKKKEKKEKKEKLVALQLDLFSALGENTTVEIISAIYGSGEKTVDVTEKVKNLYKRKENIKVSNHLGGDPCPGTAKQLFLKMSVNGEITEKTFNEKITVKI